MASGRLIREPLTIVAKRRRRRLTASVGSELAQVAEIRVHWAPRDGFPNYPVAEGEITFTDGDGWTMAVEPPDDPPEPPKFLGRLRRPRHPIEKRVVRVRDRRGIVLAEATWPESVGERVKDRKAANRRARAEARREIAGVAIDAGRGAQTLWAGRGKAKWLLVAFAGAFLAVGFLPAAIVSLVSGAAAPGIPFAVVTVVASWVAVFSWRRWRGPATCWSCASMIVGRPGTCPSCGADRPRSSTAGGDAKPVRRALSSALEWLKLTTDRLVMDQSDPTISIDGDSQVLRQSGDYWSRPSTHELGSLRIESRHRRTLLSAEKPVPFEAALLVWLLLVGDVILAKDAGGGG